MPRHLDDPDFGPIEAPAPPSREEFDRVTREALRELEARRVWPVGSVTDCPSCGRHSFVGRDDLTHEVAKPGAVVVFRHLRGARCDACGRGALLEEGARPGACGSERQGAQSLEPADLIAVEREAGVGVHPDFEAKVSRIGSGTVGTYWPKDVVRNMGLAPDTRVLIQVVDRNTALVRFQKPPHVPAAPGTRARKGKARPKAAH